MRKGKHAVLGLAALISAAAIGGTWASWTQELKAGNEFMTGSYNTSLDETFESPKNWKPGEKTEKAVQITNKGAVDAMAKVVISQSWESFPLTFQAQNGETEYAAVPEFNKNNVVLLASGDADGKTEENRWGLQAVTQYSQAEGKWLLLNEIPEGEKGIFTLYYMGIVKAGTSSPQFLDGVTMNPRITSGVVDKEYEPEYDSEGSPTGGIIQIATSSSSNGTGYENGTYTMTIDATTVQATQGAAEEIFSAGAEDGDEAQTLDYLVKNIADDGVFEAAEAKTLKFAETDGTMTYIPYRDGDGQAEEGNWFMSFTNMVPGGIYRDRLNIENDSDKTWKLYMKALPREQSALQDELLEKISMKVWYTNANGEEKLLYTGNATGSTLLTQGDTAGGTEGERAVYLGGYKGGQTGSIQVELQLDPTLTLTENPSITPEPGESNLVNKYAGVLSKIDWQFMVTEVKDDGGNGGNGGGNGGGGHSGGSGGGGGSTVTIGDNEVPLAPEAPLTDETIIEDGPVPLAVLPKTGDETPIIPAVVTLLGSGVILLWMGASLRRKKEEQ